MHEERAKKNHGRSEKSAFGLEGLPGSKGEPGSPGLSGVSSKGKLY